MMLCRALLLLTHNQTALSAKCCQPRLEDPAEDGGRCTYPRRARRGVGTIGNWSTQTIRTPTRCCRLWRRKKWGCSPLELEHAVAMVGNSVEKIEARLTALGQKRKERLILP
jgi:hypothetical protein